MRRTGWSLVFAILLGSLHRIDVARTQPAMRALPAPTTRDGPGTWTVIAARRSARTYGTRSLTEAELGQLLWAAQGDLGGHRTAPSAGALYPLTVRVADHRGIWRYVPGNHGLVQESTGDRRGDLAAAATGQTSVRDAAATFVLSGDIALVAKKYGARSAERFAILEAGHVGQNLLLAATALDLAAVPVGAFDERELRRVLALGDRSAPLYVIAVGSRP